MQEKLETTLAELVAIASVSTNADGCHEVLEFAKNELEPLGLYAHSDMNVPNPWFIATTKDTKEPDILLAAHLDVVPAPNELFFMRKENGKLYGRGVYDMKLAAACYIELFKERIGELNRRNVGILLTTDEEIGTYTVPTILENGWRPKVIFLPDGGDNWQIEAQAKGLYRTEIHAFGKSAHGSRPWEGNNALHRLSDAIHVLRLAYPSISPSDATLSVTVFQAGTSGNGNQIPDYAVAEIDFRTFSQADIIALKQLLEELRVSHKLELSLILELSPLEFNRHAPGVDSFIEALKEHTGKDIAFTQSYGASDAPRFAEYNIPSIIIEPTGGGRHSDDEWLLADDLEKYYRLIEQWVMRLPAQPDHF